MDKQKIIDKVIKLLNLAEASEFSGEAKAAKEMAADLMAKYDISISESIKKADFHELDQNAGKVELYKHDITLINAISTFNGVCFLTRGGTYGSERFDGININAHNIFIGIEKDVQCSLYMIDIVKQQRDYAWKKHLKGEKAKYGQHPGDSYREKWMQGFSYGVGAKLRELTAMKEDKIEEYGLVPIDAADAALANYKKDNKVGESKRRGSQFLSDGYDAGKDVSIHEGIESSGSVLKLN